MKIIEIKVYPLKIKKDYVYLGESSSIKEDSYYVRPEYRCCYSRNMETLMVKISTDEGIVGWGEALSPVVPEVAGTIIEKLFCDFLIGKDPRDIDVIWNMLYNTMRERGYYSGFMVDAITAVDIALWDITGKYYNAPIYQLLGGAYLDKIPAYVSNLPVPEPSEKIKLAKEWQRKGFKSIKIQAGFDFNKDVEIMSALRQALGSDFRLMVDAHWTYSSKEAIKLGKAFEKIDVEFLECPCLPEFLDENASVTASLNIPVALGEADRTHYQYREMLMKNVADIYQPDIGRTGISEMRKISILAESFGKKLAPHLSVGQGVCIAATLHMCASMPNFYGIQEFQPSILPIANEMLKKPIQCENGYFTINNAPGLGIEVDEDMVKQYAVAF